MTTTVAVSGALGRLGSHICEVIDRLDGFELVAKVTRESADTEGGSADVWVDASHPDTSPEIVERALRRGQKTVIGTSGWSAERIAMLESLITELPGAGALIVPNFSLGSVVGTYLARVTAPHFDSIEIVETHHQQKVDSPSGTAVRTAELMAEARDGREVEAPAAAQPARGTLIAGVPVHSLRLAGVVAKQEVRFGGDGETLTITHDTYTQASYSAGIRAALVAVSSLKGLTVGLEHVLGLGE